MTKLNIFFILIILVLSLSGCENNEDICPTNPSSYSNQIILNDLEVSGDSVKLTWSKLDTLKFAGYLIVRKDHSEAIVNPDDYNNEYILQKIYDPSSTSFTDKDIPLSPYLEYQVIGILTNNYSNNYIFSNSKTYERNSIKLFEYSLLQVIPDLSNNRFYFIEKNQGNISIFDYVEQKTIKSISTGATIGYSSIGRNQGIKELYVPRSDGWVFVYNAETLEKIDQIDITHPSSCVINNNGKLFISTDAWTNRPLKVFDRASKSMISESGDHDDTRMRIIPNTNSEIIEVTINIGPTDLDYYKFDANGNFISHKSDRYHGDYPLNAEIFQFFPSGDKFITDTEGAIYDINMNYINRLPKGNFKFSDYAFNTGASTIYCASSNNKKIIAYSNPQFEVVKEYTTQGYPFKIFKKGNTLISLSKTIQENGWHYNSPQNYIIEIVEL